MDKSSGMILHSFRIPVPGVTKKIIYHFSDTHLALHDDASDPQEVAKARSAAEGWNGTRLWFAGHYGEPSEAEQLKTAWEHFTALLAEAEKGDAIVLAGDLCEYVSGLNLRAMDSVLETLRIPWMAVCGNHDKAQDIPEGHLFSRAKQPVQLLDLGDLILFGVDDSERAITAQQNEALRRALTLGKPLVIVMHIPIMTEGNRALLLSCGEYFRLNHPDADEETLTFIDLLRQNADKIAAVLAGHLHFRNESELAPGLTQYVSTQGILGNINRYEIGE